MSEAARGRVVSARRRVFLGLLPPPETSRALHELCAPHLARRELAPIALGELHATLLFVGETDARTVDALAPAIAAELAGVRALDVEVSGFGAFPRSSAARVVWAGLREVGAPAPDAGLHALYTRVHRAADRLGAAREPLAAVADWIPHVTLARARRSQRAAVDATELVAALDGLRCELAWRADAVCVFESRARAPGERYAVLARIPLSG